MQLPVLRTNKNSHFIVAININNIIISELTKQNLNAAFKTFKKINSLVFSKRLITKIDGRLPQKNS